MRICGIHDVLAVHVREGFPIGIQHELSLPQEKLEPMGWRHVVAMGVASGVYRDCLPAPRLRCFHYRSQKDRDLKARG
jgi:hypothetical protein